MNLLKRFRMFRITVIAFNITANNGGGAFQLSEWRIYE